MSERSLFPDGVVVTTEDLQRTEETRSQQTKDLGRELSAYPRVGQTTAQRGSGIVEGLRVTVNGAGLNIGTGVAYVTNGERVVVDTGQVAIALSDYTDTVVNLICLIYTETASTPHAHETDGTTRMTEAVPGFRVRAYTQSQFNALPATSTNMDLDAQDRALVLATALGNGAPAGVPNALVSGEISQGLLLAVVAVEYIGTPIMGVNITQAGVISTGTGTLELVQAAGVSTLRFSAPGSSFAAGVNVSVGGNFNVFSTDGSAVSVAVDQDSILGNGTGTFTPTLAFTNLYDAIVPGFHYGASDNAHRERIGAIAPDPQNPHGVEGSTMGHGFIELPNIVRVGSTVASSSARNNAARLTIVANVGGTRQHVAKFTPRNISLGGDIDVRMYKFGIDGGLEFTYNAIYDNVAGEWDNDDATEEAYLLRFGGVFNDSFTLLSRAALAAPWTDGDWVPVINASLTDVTMPGIVTAGSFAASIINNPASWTMGTSTFRCNVSPADATWDDGIAGVVFQQGGINLPPAGVGGVDPDLVGAPGMHMDGATVAGKGFWVPLQLPHGAIVTVVSHYIEITASGDECRAAIVRLPLTAAGTYATMRSGTSYDVLADSAGLATTRTLTINTNTVVDTATYAYALWFGNNGGALDMTWYGAEIRYTLALPFTH